MLRLLDDLLTLSALESSPPPPMEEWVDMGCLVERLGADARALSRGRHRIEVVMVHCFQQTFDHSVIGFAHCLSPFQEAHRRPTV